MISSRSSFASFRRFASYGNKMFWSTQVASKINISVFSPSPSSVLSELRELSGVFIVHEDYFINLQKDIFCQAFEELNKKGRDKRSLELIVRQANEVLKIRVFYNLFDQLPVREAQLFLWISREPSAVLRDFAGIPVLLGNIFAYLFFSGVPRNGCGFLTRWFSEFIFKPTGWSKSISPS